MIENLVYAYQSFVIQYQDNYLIIVYHGLNLVVLPTDLLDYEIRDYLSKFGIIIYFFYVKHKKSKKFTGNVYVTYSTQKENNDAIENIPKKPLGYVFPTVEYATKSTF